MCSMHRIACIISSLLIIHEVLHHHLPPPPIPLHSPIQISTVVSLCSLHVQCKERKWNVKYNNITNRKTKVVSPMLDAMLVCESKKVEKEKENHPSLLRRHEVFVSVGRVSTIKVEGEAEKLQYEKPPKRNFRGK